MANGIQYRQMQSYADREKYQKLQVLLQITSTSNSPTRERVGESARREGPGSADY